MHVECCREELKRSYTRNSVLRDILAELEVFLCDCDCNTLSAVYLEFRANERGDYESNRNDAGLMAIM